MSFVPPLRRGAGEGRLRRQGAAQAPSQPIAGDKVLILGHPLVSLLGHPTSPDRGSHGNVCVQGANPNPATLPELRL